jgi:hypothetical protein
MIVPADGKGTTWPAEGGVALDALPGARYILCYDDLERIIIAFAEAATTYFAAT